MSFLEPTEREHRWLRYLIILCFVALIVSVMQPAKAETIPTNNSFEGYSLGSFTGLSPWLAYVSGSQPKIANIVPHTGTREGNIWAGSTLCGYGYDLPVIKNETTLNIWVKFFSNSSTDSYFQLKMAATSPSYSEYFNFPPNTFTVGEWKQISVKFNNTIRSGIDAGFLAKNMNVSIDDFTYYNGTGDGPPGGSPSPAGAIYVTNKNYAPYIQGEDHVLNISYVGTPTHLVLKVFQWSLANMLYNNTWNSGFPSEVTYEDSRNGTITVYYEGICNGSLIFGGYSYEVYDVNTPPTPTVTPASLWTLFPTFTPMVPVQINMTFVNTSMFQPYYDVVDSIFEPLNSTIGSVEGVGNAPLDLLTGQWEWFKLQFVGLLMMVQATVGPIAFINQAVSYTLPPKVQAYITFVIALGIIKQILATKI